MNSGFSFKLTLSCIIAHTVPDIDTLNLSTSPSTCTHLEPSSFPVQYNKYNKYNNKYYYYNENKFTNLCNLKFCQGEMKIQRLKSHSSVSSSCVIVYCWLVGPISGNLQNFRRCYNYFLSIKGDHTWSDAISVKGDAGLADRPNTLPRILGH